MEPWLFFSQLSSHVINNAVSFRSIFISDTCETENEPLRLSRLHIFAVYSGFVIGVLPAVAVDWAGR